jgi:hypothetical protein
MWSTACPRRSAYRLTLPPAVARRFVLDMRAFHAEPNAIKADEILHALKQHNTGKLPDPRIGRRDSARAADSFFVVSAPT